MQSGSTDSRRRSSWHNRRDGCDELPDERARDGSVVRQGWNEVPAGCIFQEVPIVGHEAAWVLAAAFHTCVGEAASFPAHAQVLAAIEERSNYQVVQVVRVQNILRAGMHDSFKQVYNIQMTRVCNVVYVCVVDTDSFLGK